jgi:hypothetical protein
VADGAPESRGAGRLVHVYRYIGGSERATSNPILDAGVNYSVGNEVVGGRCCRDKKLRRG